MAYEYRYLDIIWLDNLLMNFIMLWVVWKISKNLASMWRLWCSACIGAVYVVLLLLPKFQILSLLSFKIILSLIMVLVAFKLQGLKNFMMLLGMFYAITFLFGGAALGFYFFGINIDIRNGVFFIRNFPIKLILFSTVTIIMLHRWLLPILQVKFNREKFIYKIEIEFDNKSILLDSFLDTGNCLVDPISKIPVMIVEFNLIREILPADIQNIFILNLDTGLDKVTKIISNSKWIKRFRVIPYNTLNNVGGLLIAFKPDKAQIYVDDTWKEIKEVMIGIRNQKLSSQNEYQALIQTQIIP